jgi:UDP-N-acetyl-alpha-D-muramoyl-L-alanyl-L-glutamate epimerase
MDHTALDHAVDQTTNRSEQLRAQYPTFIYSGFSWKLVEADKEKTGDLLLSFTYNIPPDINFTHHLTIRGVTQDHLSQLTPAELDNYVFQLGLAEMYSYWKTTCSGEIEIKAGSLHQDQANFWHRLLIEGMGEFFYVNQIDFLQPDFVRFGKLSTDNNILNAKTEAKIEPTTKIDHIHSIIVPLGGGKDSIVTLELLRQHLGSDRVGVAFVNPTQASLDIAQAIGAVEVSAAESASEATNTANTNKPPQAIRIDRQLDPHLLELNHQGYLNGHVPVSAVFAFSNLLAGRLFGYSHVAISNEASSNEGNIEYLGQHINHQYSKSFQFEQDLQSYVAAYLPQGTPFYFSFLRPLFELQIARLFTKMTSYHHLFRSCNRGQKSNSWCGQCSKCLFAYVALLSFLQPMQVEAIFGQNLLNNLSLWPLVKEQLGLAENKPFECVGTYEETIAAFFLATRQYADIGLQSLPPTQNHQSPHQEHLPPLLERVQNEILNHEPNLDQRANAILNSWNNQHRLPPELEKALAQALHL